MDVQDTIAALRRDILIIEAGDDLAYLNPRKVETVRRLRGEIANLILSTKEGNMTCR